MILAWLAIHAALAQEPRRAPAVSVFDVGVERRVHDGCEGDVDGDGNDDLVLALSREGAGRELAIFRARTSPGQTPFQSQADVRIELTPDVVAFALGDVDGKLAGKEIVLFSGRGAFVCRPFASAEQRFGRLFECDFLWQLADEQACFAYPDALIDLDRDGAVDVVVPEPGGFAIARQGTAGFESVQRLRIPEELAARSSAGSTIAPRISGERTRRVEVSLGSAGGSRTLLAVDESVPAPQLRDFDGDGRVDVIAQGIASLWVWIQGPGGSFSAAPARSFPLPVVADRERRLDASYSAQVLDVDLDQRADVAIFAGDRRSDDVRTQLLWFVQGKGRGDGAKTPEAPLFGPKGLPQQVLVLGGFAAGAYFEDLDGDRRPDLYVRTVRPDLIDQLRSASSERLDADLLVYRNDNGELVRRPSLSWRVSIPIQNFDLTLRFVGDLDGDGLSDLALRSEPDRLKLLAMRRARDGFQFDAKPLYETAIARDATLLLLDRSDRRARDVAVVDGAQVMLVRFR